MVVYKTTNLINGKFYVGKDVENDNSYLGSGKILKQAIKKYGRENFKKEILEHCSSKEELDEREKFWIKELSAIEQGYNLTEGGTGGDTWTKAKRNEHWNVGRVAWNRGQKPSNETVEKIRNAKKKFFENNPDKKTNSGSFSAGSSHREYGKSQSAERVQKRVEKLKQNGTYSNLKEMMKGNSHAKTKRICQTDLEGNIISEFISTAEASRALNIPKHRIYFVLKGKQKQTNGFGFIYA